MKTALILAGAVTLVLMTMERPASGSPAPAPSAPKEAIEAILALKALDEAIKANGGRQKRSLWGDLGKDLEDLVHKGGDKFGDWVDGLGSQKRSLWSDLGKDLEDLVNKGEDKFGDWVDGLE